jgi:hypothetical protein
MPIMTHRLLNTGRREGAEMSTCRRAAPVPPAERAGSEEREKVQRIDGAFAPKVFRFDSGFAAEGSSIA